MAYQGFSGPKIMIKKLGGDYGTTPLHPGAQMAWVSHRPGILSAKDTVGRAGSGTSRERTIFPQRPPAEGDGPFGGLLVKRPGCMYIIPG